MIPRRFTATLFIVLCLALSGLLLRHQIALHPRHPSVPDTPQMMEDPISPDFLGQPIDKRTWHTVMGVQRQAVLTSIQGQLDALRAGDSAKALSYQSRFMRQRFSSPEAFATMIYTHYPEFGHSRSASFGPVWIDASGQHADVTVIVRGTNGNLAQGDYQMIHGREIYRVAGVIGGGRVKD